MKIFTAPQLKSWDAYTILHEPIESIVLMERAAHACYQWIRLELPLQEDKEAITARSVKIFCGKGNNGGDGLEVARMFLNDGIAATVYVLNSGTAGTKAFDIKLKALEEMNTQVQEIQSLSQLPHVDQTDIVVDALFGTGLNKPLDSLAAALVKHINESNATIVSLDLPSGLFADESSKGLPVIKAKYTLSFQGYKLAFLLPENEQNVGKIFIVDINLHKQFETNEPVISYLTDLAMIKSLYRKRSKFAHKGNLGHAILMAGSPGKMGAATLASNACLRSGVGLLTVQVPEVGYEILQASAPEAMTVTEHNINYEAYTVAGIGPGLGTSKEAINRLTEVLDHSNQLKNAVINDLACLVLDADALNILSLNPHLLQRLPARTILTPHPKEFERLFGSTANEFDRLQLALSKAKQYQCFIVLKGHHSFIACPQGIGYFNNTGNAGMATGGTGDVLTGIITGLAAQGYTALESCLLGVYLHGLAGDIAAEKFSQEAMLAGDMIRCLGEAFKKIS